MCSLVDVPNDPADIKTHNVKVFRISRYGSAPYHYFYILLPLAFWHVNVYILTGIERILKRLRELEIQVRIPTIQTTALLTSVAILSSLAVT